MATTTKPDEPAVEAEPVETAEKVFDDIQHGLLLVVRDAVDADTGHGVDVTLAAQAADVYNKLFGVNR